MFYKIISELLILVLLAISCIRVLFIRNTRQDPIASVPIIVMVILVAYILAFSVSTIGFIIAFLTFFVFFWNLRALMRLSAHLIIDHYSPIFIFISMINFVLVMGCIALVIFYRPMFNLKKTNVEKQSFSYYGTLTDGFETIKEIRQYKTAFIYRYASKKQNDEGGSNKGTVLFIPNECVPADAYEPIFVELAQKGLTVYAAEFYTKDIKWFGDYRDLKIFRTFFLSLYRFIKPSVFHIAQMNKSDNLSREFVRFSELVDMIDSSNKEKVFWISDYNCIPAMELAVKNLKKASNDITKPTLIDLAQTPAYTSPGWGPIQQTNPFLAFLMKVPDDPNPTKKLMLFLTTIMNID